MSGNTEAATDLQRELDSIKQMLAQVSCSMPGGSEEGEFCTAQSPLIIAKSGPCDP